MPGQTDLIKPGTFSNMGLETLPDIFDHSLQMYGTSVMMKKKHAWGYQSITYQDFGKLTSFLGAGLIARGLEKGDRVALMAENSPEWVITYAAVTSCGAAVMPLDTGLQQNELRHILLHSEAKFLVVSPRIFNRLVDGMNLRNVEVIVMEEQDSAVQALTLGAVMASGKEGINNGNAAFFQRKAEVGPGDTAAICYTSGTTGQPKGAVLLHSNLLSNLESIRGRLPFAKNDVFLCLLPLHHTFTTMCVFLAPCSCGAAIVFARSMKPKIFMEDISAENVTVLVGVPLLFDHMAPLLLPAAKGGKKGKGAFSRLFLKLAYGIGKLFGRKMESSIVTKKLVSAGLEKVKFCVTGAAPLKAEVEYSFFSAGLPLLQGYGLTEASPVVSVNPLDKPRKGTVGPALPGILVEIDNPDADGIGEILVKGPNVMKEYFRNSEATSASLRRGYLYTGDLGRIDEEGYLTICGRKKSMIVTAGGKNVYPDEIEALLSKSAYILESIVLPVEDRKGNVRPGAVIVPNYDTLGTVEQLRGRLTDENIREFMATELKALFVNVQDYKHLLDFQIRDQELPKTSTRKVKRHLVTWIRE